MPELVRYDKGMAKREPVYTIYGKKELRALASSARQEISGLAGAMTLRHAPRYSNFAGDFKVNSTGRPRRLGVVSLFDRGVERVPTPLRSGSL